MARLPKRKLIIAIDGPAGSGKSTTAKVLAQKLNLPYIDTGAMYRAVTLKAMQKNIPFSNINRLAQIAKKIRIRFVEASGSVGQRIFLDGRDVTEKIRTPELTRNVFRVAQEPLIRREMVKKQRELGLKKGAVMEGRDIGTVVFPKADFKFYFEADLRIRTKRRSKDLISAGAPLPALAQVRRDIRRRDRHDKTRFEGPLRCAKDAIRMDTSSLTIAQTADRILRIVGKK